MGIVAGIAAAAATASLAGSVDSMVSGGPSGGANGTYGGQSGVYIPPNQGVAGNQYQNLVAKLYGANPGDAFASNYLGDLGGIQGNPYVTGLIDSANTAGGYGTTVLAPAQQGGASSLFGAGNTVLNTAFDPQNTLYNLSAQNVLGQSAVANAQAGVQGPAAAGVTDNNINNFNIDWQNQQLARQLQGIQGAGRAYAGGSDLGGAAMNTMTTSGALPYDTFNNYYSGLMGLENTASGDIQNAYGMDYKTLAALSSYLNLGQGASGLAQAGEVQGFNQNQQLGQNIGSALNSLSNNQGLQNLFSGGSNTNAPGTSYGSTDYFGGGYSDPYAASTDMSGMSGVNLAY